MTVLIADGRKLVREGLTALLARHASIEVIGEADDPLSAARLARALLPQIILLHLSTAPLPAATENVRVLSRLARVIALATTLGPDTARDLLASGASGCLTRECTSTDLLAAIDAAVANRLYLSPPLADATLRRLSPGPSRARRPLSSREREILRMIAEGRSTKEIAADLLLGTKTVETHRRRMMEKLGLWSVAELTRFAIAQGLVEVD